MLAPLADVPPETAEPPGRVITVVVADDDDAFRAGMVSALGRSDGITVVASVADGLRALEAALDLQPDVLLVDERMPGLSGTEIAERVQVDWRLVGVRVVVMSGESDAELSRRARTAGVVTCIDKVRSRREIVTTVRNAGR